MWPRLGLSAASSAALLLAALGAATLAVEAGWVAGRELAATVALGASLVVAVVVAGRRSWRDLAASALLGPPLAWGAAHALDALVVTPLELSARSASAVVVVLGLAGLVSSEAATRRASARACGGP